MKWDIIGFQTKEQKEAMEKDFASVESLEKEAMENGWEREIVGQLSHRNLKRLKANGWECDAEMAEEMFE